MHARPCHGGHDERAGGADWPLVEELMEADVNSREEFCANCLDATPPSLNHRDMERGRTFRGLVWVRVCERGHSGKGSSGGITLMPSFRPFSRRVVAPPITRHPRSFRGSELAFVFSCALSFLIFVFCSLLSVRERSIWFLDLKAREGTKPKMETSVQKVKREIDREPGERKVSCNFTPTPWIPHLVTDISFLAFNINPLRREREREIVTNVFLLAPPRLYAGPELDVWLRRYLVRALVWHAAV